MRLKEIMTQDVQLASPGDTLCDIAEKMKEEDAGAVPVCDGDKIIGMITDRDIVIRALAEGKDPGKTKVSDVMTKHVFFAFEDEDIRLAARLMQRKQIRRVLVLNREKRLVGLASLGDLASHLSTHDLVGDTLKQISGPSSPQSYFKELKKVPEKAGIGSIMLTVGAACGIALGYAFIRRQEISEQILKRIA